MIETERLNLRPWRDSDREPFAAMSRDSEVMATLGPLMSRAESDALIDRLMAADGAFGEDFSAVERKSDGAFLGLNGLKTCSVGPLAGEIEIGWRLPRHAWGRGYATEGAAASLAWAWANCPDAALVMAMTSRGNLRSQAVMRRIGMTERPELIFDHPRLADGDPLRPHIVFAVDRR